jgi:hypothetical protein
MKKIALLFFVTLLISCDSKTYEEISSETKNPTFEKDIKPIINSNCVTCHNPNGISSFLPLTSFEGVKAAVQSNDLIFRIETATGEQSMPLNGPKLSKNSIELIKLWSQNGFKN